jgi:hypothetical protein
MNVVIRSRRQPKKFDVPHRSQDQSDYDNAPGKCRRGEKFADGCEIRDTRSR